MKLLALVASLWAACSCMVVALPALMPAAASSVMPGPAAGPTGHVVRIDPIAPLFADVPAGGFPTWGYAWGNCTWWAAYNRHLPQSLGNAADWLHNAAADGIALSDEPSVGAVIVYRAGPGYDPSYGHVAVVIGVGPESIRVSEMNFVGLNVVDERDSPWPDPRVEGFIP